MVPESEHSDQLFAIRPLVRYVDEQQSVIDIHFTAKPSDETGANLDPTASPLSVCVRVIGPDGYVYEHDAHLKIHDQDGTIRFEIDHPQRWWPSGMGDQVLYDLSVVILVNDEMADQWQTTIGLTSVRPGHCESSAVADSPPASIHAPSLADALTLLVNGRQIAIRSIVPVDPADEQNVLPVVDQCLLVIRGHYGPDLLYNAADRAGTLCVQSIPDDFNTSQSIQTQINRLASHPSLAGWLVGTSNKAGDEIADCVRTLDPTRNVFRHLPES